MTINDAITSTDALLHNTYPTEKKVEWLSKVDGMVKRHIIDTHTGADRVRFTGYTANTAMDTVLLVPEPFSEMYLRWMEAQIHYHNGEYSKYNNAILLFNTEFDAYAAFYNQNHMPVSKGRFLF